jgi:hypothetical protein
MATAKQEQLYNRIIEYYHFSDRLVSAVENSSSDLSQEQFLIVEDMVENLEKSADQLTTLYIKFIKNGDANKEISDEVKQTINDIIVKIEDCRNKIIAIYDHNLS